MPFGGSSEWASTSGRSSDGSASPPPSSEATVIEMLQSSTAASDADDDDAELLLPPPPLDRPNTGTSSSSRVPSPLSFASSSSRPGATHTHIHHHYHLSTRKASSSSLASKGDSSLESVPDYFAAENYRSSSLARKLGFAQQPGLPPPSKRAPGAAAAAHSGGWFAPRRGRRRDSNREAPPAYTSALATSSSPIYLESSTYSWAAPFSKQFLARVLRQPFVPTQPLSVLFTLVLVVSFFFSASTLIAHILDNDKAPLPWRAFCLEQAPFPHRQADALAPVNVFVGVFSVDAAYERRHLVRSTYLRHSRPRDPKTGRPAHHVQLKFILGRPRKQHARRVALEMETYNDVVVLDIPENMNKGKTYQYFKWASENATVPVFYHQAGRADVHVGFQKADYVVKADDDAFIVLSELERHLRVSPRKQTYWGYLVRNLFMAGEAYALSADLVDYVATYPPLAEYANGKEDKKVARWMRMHPNSSSINWVTERCWIYDHPKAGTTYSHGFLFPDHVARMRLEADRGIAADAAQAGRGDAWAQSYSSVVDWQKQYAPPAHDLTTEEEVEALIEGGGLWGPEDGWRQEPVPKERYIDYTKMRFEAGDRRLYAGGNLKLPPQQRQAQAASSELADDPQYASRFNKVPVDLIRDVEEPLFPFEETGDPSLSPVRGVPRQRHAQMPSLVSTEYEHRVPPPTLRYDTTKLMLRNRRMLNLPYGGTVIVHYLKRNEWFLETALALLGRHHFWDSGLTPAAYSSSYGDSSQVDDPAELTPWNGKGVVEVVDARWGSPRMYGSPLVRSNGYVTEGRESPYERLQQLPVQDAPQGHLRGRPKMGLADPDPDVSSESPASSSSMDSSRSSMSPSSTAGSATTTSSEAGAPSETRPPLVFQPPR